MPWIRPQNRSPVTALSPWQPLGALGEKEECMRASNWGRYLNIVKLHDHSRQKLADFAFGNEVGDREKGAGYLRPAHPRERGSSPASWGRLKRDSERETSRDLPDAERAWERGHATQAERSEGTGAKRGHLLFLCKLWQALYLSLRLCFPVWIWDVPMKYKY